MKIDNNVYYKRQKRNVLFRLLLALLIFTAVSAAYLVIDRNIAVKTIADVANTDYSGKSLSLCFNRRRSAHWLRAGRAAG